MKVQAWECEHCGKLFKTHQAATNCKIKCAKKIADTKAAELRAAEMLARSDEIRLNVSYIDEVPSRIVEFVKKYMDRDITFSQWNVSFKEKLATTHDAPIGKNTSGWGNETIYYPGWEGRVEGSTNLYKKPFKLGESDASFDNIDGFSDLFDGFGKRIIRGIHTGSGSGGEKFSYTIRMYIEDFPKIKAMYNTYLPLKNKHNAYVEQVKELSTKARMEIVEGDKRLATLRDIDKLLRLKLKQVEAESIKVSQNIMASAKYTDAIKPSKKYEYDSELFQKLRGNFG